MAGGGSERYPLLGSTPEALKHAQEVSVPTKLQEALESCCWTHSGDVQDRCTILGIVADAEL